MEKEGIVQPRRNEEGLAGGGEDSPALAIMGPCPDLVADSLTSPSVSAPATGQLLLKLPERDTHTQKTVGGK